MTLLGFPAWAGSPPEWRVLAPGMDLGILSTRASATAGDARITVLRIDPNLWELGFAGASESSAGSGGTAREWCKRRGFTAAINAGMFAADRVTHVGYLRSREHVNSDHPNDYQSVAAFDPRGGRVLPRFRIFDLDDPGVTVQSISKEYASAVQNLRLIKRPGINRWGQQQKRWSEAALGEDSGGRILFIFSGSPFSMHDLGEELLASGIGLAAAQHLEGGPEAQLYVKLNEFELEQFGRYETPFRENEGNTIPWPIPNVLGVRPRSPPARK
ncbi:MAG TPA: phosphodiester glycosidase family protein [Myxococcota bacterium]|nr:phosphodiester glycosidase family protein [Myxococcota bacterium]